jgi:hypothetical protein
MKRRPPEYTLEFLLDFDGRIHWLERGYRIEFKIRRVEVTPRCPHGLEYSFTLHGPDGQRLLGFDNAHPVRAKGSKFKWAPKASDHWHRTEKDRGRPYAFKDADTLLADFFQEVRRTLAERGISDTVVKDAEKRK